MLSRIIESASFLFASSLLDKVPLDTYVIRPPNIHSTPENESARCHFSCPALNHKSLPAIANFGCSGLLEEGGIRSRLFYRFRALDRAPVPYLKQERGGAENCHTNRHAAPMRNNNLIDNVSPVEGQAPR